MFADIHELAADGDGIWVTSSLLDAVLKVDTSGSLLEEHFLGELPAEVRDPIGIRSHPIDRSVDQRRHARKVSALRSHPNAIHLVDGRPHVGLMEPGAVIALNPMELVWRN